MTPTTKLRFLERKVAMHPFYKDMATGGRCYETYHVLQQWWEDPDSFDMITARPTGEWRDVPVEKEKA